MAKEKEVVEEESLTNVKQKQKKIINVYMKKGELDN